jgi:D-alanyl-D-alanine endopeptidase (penicillin-binding protein 7)
MRHAFPFTLPALASLLLAVAPAAAKAPPKRHGRVKHAVARAVPVYLHNGQPNIQARAAVVLDLDGNQELFAKNADEVRPIASISKLMAMMVVLDRKLDLEGVTEMLPSDRDAAKRGAKSRLPTGMSFTNRDLIHAALMGSDNRAVLALGRATGLSIEQLTQAMNQRAKALGLPNTSFGDPTGLDDRNRSTPREVAKMLGAALKVPMIAEITRKKQYVAHAVSRPNYAIEYNNTDVLARGSRFEVLAGKTGYTDLAGYCLAIAAKLPQRNVAMVFLGAVGKLTRFADFTRAAQWIAEKQPAAASAKL